MDTQVSENFDKAITIVLRHEGGFVDHKSDPGGATNHGVSLRFLQTIGDLDGDGYQDGDLDQDGDVDAEDIKAMTMENAVGFYRSQWWDRYGYGRILNVDVAAKVFDLAVNMGAHQAHLILQRALRSAGQPVTEDGIIGSKTIDAVNGAISHVLLAAMRSESAGFYRVLIAKKPDLGTFKNGWIKRAYS